MFAVRGVEEVLGHGFVISNLFLCGGDWGKQCSHVVHLCAGMTVIVKGSHTHSHNFLTGIN